jgi:tRNA nucleotidyltransferase/poly(A) polymerase
MDPFNGMADIEAKLLRVLNNYAFVEDPSRLIRAARFSARFHWPLEERTQMRYDSAKENNYIEYITNKGIGLELAQIGYEDDPLHVLKHLEKEGWLKILSSHWTSAKADAVNLGQLVKTRQQMNEMGYLPDTAPAAMYFLTSRLSNKEISDIQKLIPRKDLVEAWRDIEDHGKELAKRLTGKEAATPSRTWKLLSEARPEMILFLSLTSRQQAVQQKIKNFFTKWRQVQQKVPLPEMTELLITPAMPEYPKIAHDVFMLLLDGKLRSRTETLKYLKPLAPPPPPPPPAPVRRGRAKAAVGAPAAAAAAGKKKAKAAVAAAPAAPATNPTTAKTASAPAGKKAAVVPPPVSAKVVVKAVPAKPVAKAGPPKPDKSKAKHPPKKPAGKKK